MAGDSLEAAIHLIGKNDVSAMLKQIGAEMLGLHGQVDKLNSKLKQIGSGAIKLGAAFGISEFIADLAKANGLLERQVGIFRMAGNSAADASRGRQAAYSASASVRGSGVAENFKLFRELSGELGDSGAARKILPDMAKAQQILNFLNPNGSGEKDMLMLMRSVGLRGGAINKETGKLDPAMFSNELNEMVRVLQAGQGLLGPNDMFNFLKQAGTAGKIQRGNPHAFWGDMIAAFEDQGGSRTGTAVASVWDQFVGGHANQRAYALLKEDGFIGKEGWTATKQGIRIDDSEKAFGEYYKTLNDEGAVGLFNKMIDHYKNDLHLNDEDVEKRMQQRLGRQTVRRLESLVHENKEQTDAVHARYDKTTGLKGMDTVNNDYLHNLESLGTAFHTLESSLGASSTIAPALGSIADGINKLAAAAGAHPGIGKAITLGGGAAAVGLGTYGAIQVGRGLWSMASGFGLPAAATQLSAAAVALDGAALKIGGGVAGGAVGVAKDIAKGAAGAGALAGGAAIVAGLATLGATVYGADKYKEAHPELFHGGAKAEAAYKSIADANAHAKVFGPFRRDYGPYRHWEEGTTSGRGRAAVPAHWELGKDADDAGKTAGKQAAAGFKATDFAAAGKAGGKSVADGFHSAAFGAAGATAAKQLIAGFVGAIGNGAIGVHMYGAKVGRLVAKHQVAMMEHPNSIGAADSYGSHMGPGTDLPAWG